MGVRVVRGLIVTKGNEEGTEGDVNGGKRNGKENTEAARW